MCTVPGAFHRWVCSVSTCRIWAPPCYNCQLNIYYWCHSSDLNVWRNSCFYPLWETLLLCVCVCVL
jgi:hypothetical protein